MYAYKPKSLRVPTDLSSEIRLTNRGESFKSSLEYGLDTAVGWVTNPAKNWYAGEQDKKNGLKPVTQEDYEAYQKNGLPIEPIGKDEYPTQLHLRAKEIFNNTLLQQKINDEYPVTNMVGMFAPQILDPANFIPFGSVLRSGKTLSSVDKLNAAIMQGNKWVAAKQSYKNYAAEAFVSNAAVSPLYYKDMQYRGENPTGVDVLLDIGLGTGIATGFFGSIASYRNYQRAGKNLNNVQTFQDIYKFMETGDFEQATNAMYQSSPDFRKRVKAVSELSDVVIKSLEDGNLDFSTLDDGQVQALLGALRHQFERGLHASLSKTMSEEIVGDLSTNDDIVINDYAYNQRNRYATIAEAIEDGDISRLNDRDKAIAETVVRRTAGVSDSIEEGDGFLPTESTKGKLNFNFDNLGSMAEAHKRAGNIVRLIRDEGVSNLEDLVNKGVISEKQREKALREFNKVYEKAYARELSVANTVINNIFGREFTFVKMAKETQGVKRAKSGVLMGEAFRNEDKITLNRAEVILGMGKSPFSVMIHEAVHILQAKMPEVYAELNAAIRKHPDFVEQIRKYKGHYETDAVEGEIPSVTLEWAITQEAFWKQLQKTNQTLFERFAEALVDIIKRTKELFSKSKLNTEFLDDVDKLLVDMTPETFATQLAVIINKGRKHNLPYNEILEANKSVSDNVANLLYTEPVDVKQKTPADRLVDDYKPEKTVAAQNAKLREHRRQTFNRLAATTMPNVRGENVQRFVETLTNYIDELAEGVDPEAQEFISFDEYRARIREFTSEIVDEDLTREDILSATEYNELYENLRMYAMNIVNDKSLLRNNDLYRKVIRGTVDLEQTSVQYRSAKNRIVKEYYEDKAQTIVSNAMKRAAINERLRNFETDAQKLAYLRTLLDGQERKGMPRIAGLENEMTANSQNAAVPILDVIYKHGLDELFMPDNSFGIFKHDRRDKRFSMFGKKRKERSYAFHRQLHQALLARKLPKEWEAEPALKELFDVILATEVRSLQELNAAGLDIKMLSDFGGVSQKWDGTIIHNMGFKKFKARMLEVMDIEATGRAHAGVLFVDGKEEVFTADIFLEQWYDTLNPSKRIDSDVQVFDLEETFGGRMVRIKPEYATDVMLEFSGYDNVGYLMLQQIQRRSALATMASFAGTKPNEMLSGLTRGLRTARGKNAVDAKSYKATVDSLTGILDNPVDSTLATFENKVKQYSNLVFLSGSGISSLTDIPLVASTLEMMGIKFGETNKLFLEAYAEGMRRRFGNDKDGMREFFLGQGAGFDAINNQVIRRLSDTTTNVGKMDKLHNLLFKVNGLNALTTTHQELFVDVLTQGIAREFDKPAINRELRSNLIDFGFTAEEINSLRKGVTQSPDGTYRLVPTGIRSAELAQKYRQYITKYMRQAVFMPDAGTNAQMTLGFRKGTFAGTLTRIATQYQPFMLGMTKLLYRRFKNGDFGKGDSAMMYKTAHLVSYIGGALAFGYMATVLKDIARGEKPISLLDMRAYQWSRIVQQSGILGVLEVPLDIKDYGVQEALSPLPSTIFGLAVDLSTGDSKGAMKNLQSLTGSNVFGPPQWFHGLIGQVMTEYLAEIQQDLLEDLDNMSFSQIKNAVDKEVKAGNIAVITENGKPVKLITKDKETKALVNEFKERIHQK